MQKNSQAVSFLQKHFPAVHIYAIAAFDSGNMRKARAPM